MTNRVFACAIALGAVTSWIAGHGDAALAGEPTRTTTPDASSASQPTASQVIDLTPQQLRRATHDRLRALAKADATSRDAAIRDLVSLYRQLLADERLPDKERRELAASVRSRLLRTSDALARDLKQPGKAAGAKLPAREQQRLAQRVPPGNGNAAGNQPGNFPPANVLPGNNRGANVPPGNNAQELIDLIQNTVSPASWDVNGGRGTIRFFAPSNLLVIRQTAEMHGNLAPVLEQLRK